MTPSRVADGSQRGYIVAIGGAEDKVNNQSILRSFLELCGGEKASITIIPTASQSDDTGTRYSRILRDLGARSTKVLDFTSREECGREDLIEQLRDSDGVFIAGGNQLRLSTILGGTAVAQILRRMNAEGVTVAGTSAGAGFVSEHMIAHGDEGSSPRAQMVTISPGLGLTNKVIIDHHFQQRDRMGRLLAALSYNPFAVGIGLDEDTAAFITPDDHVEVVGSGSLTIVDPSELEHSSLDSARENEPVCLVGIKLHFLVDGWSFDLASHTATRSAALAR